MKNIQFQLITPCFSKLLFFISFSVLVEILQTPRLDQDTQIGHGKSMGIHECLCGAPSSCKWRLWIKEGSETTAHAFQQVLVCALALVFMPPTHESTCYRQKESLQGSFMVARRSPERSGAGGHVAPDLRSQEEVCVITISVDQSQTQGCLNFISHWLLFKKCLPQFSSFLIIRYNIQRERERLVRATEMEQ